MSDSRTTESLRKQLDAMVKFPDQNPNPVLKMSTQGKLLYANHAGRVIVDTWLV